MLGLAESISAGKSVASFSGDRINADREFIGQGLAKIAVAFTSGLPVSGSPTRSLLNYRSGAVTKFSNIVASLFLATIVLIFTPFVKYIPVAALAGMLITIAANMVNWEHAKVALRATRADAAAMIATFVAALVFPLDTAIYIGVGVSLVLFLRRIQNPRLTELVYSEEEGFREIIEPKERPIPEISIVNIEGDVFFGASDFLDDRIIKAVRDEMEVLILRMKRAYSLDATTILTLMKFVKR